MKSSTVVLEREGAHAQRVEVHAVGLERASASSIAGAVEPK